MPCSVPVGAVTLGRAGWCSGSCGPRASHGASSVTHCPEMATACGLRAWAFAGAPGHLQTHTHADTAARGGWTSMSWTAQKQGFINLEKLLWKEVKVPRTL